MAELLERGSSERTFDGNIRNERLALHVAWVRRGYEPECAGWNERRDICLIFSGEDFDLERKTAALVGRGRKSGPKRSVWFSYMKSSVPSSSQI